MAHAMKLLIIAENPLARMGLAALLAGNSAVTIVGQSGGANLAMEIDLYQPDIMIWDWGWQNVPEIPKDIPVVALLKEAGQASEAWNAGARGLLLGEIDSDVLISTLTTVSQGLAVFEPTLAASMFQTNTPDVETPTEALTSREMEVLQLLAEGLPNKIIASKLSITDHTVKFHVNAIMSKLGVQSRTEAVVRATKLGLIIL